MGVTRRTDSQVMYLQAKHFCWWQELKAPAEDCSEVEVTNPTNGKKSIKYGFQFDAVSGRAVKMEKYDRRHDGKRYFGFKLHLKDGPDLFVLDMPYHSGLLRRFLKVMPNINWNEPLKIAVFKGKKEGGGEELGVWFQQPEGKTVPVYFTKDNPRGMPPPVHDPNEDKWDFRDQHSWLVSYLKDNTIPDIEMSAAKAAPPVPPVTAPAVEPEDEFSGDPPPPNEWHPTDDDVPF